MRIIVIIAALFLFPLLMPAQKVSVTTSIDDIGGGYNSAYHLTMPDGNKENVEKEWNRFLKKNRGKVKSKRENITAKYVRINGLGDDTLTVYSRIYQKEEGIILAVAFKKNDKFISPDKNETYSHTLVQLLNDFGQQQREAGVALQLKAAEKLLSSKEKEKRKLGSTISSLKSANENMRTQITKNEEAIIRSDKRLEELEIELGAQHKVIESIKAKTKINE